MRVSALGTTVNIRGPTSAVETLVAKCTAFIEQEKADEKERGFTLDFEFPQKFANHLIGKGGSNIRELRDKFDVEIQVQDGKVELRGPKAKAEAAKSHILSLGRQLADEASYTLKIDPKFHKELIGAQGSQINRLQTRYKVLIFFPRSAKNAKEDESVADAASEAGKPRRQQAPDEVLIRGPKKGADEARDEILSLVQYLRDNSFTASVSVQRKQVPSLIGAGGSGMDQLRQATGARIDIPNDRESTESVVEIQIKGTKAQVAAAKKILEEKKAVFDDTLVKTIEVDKKYHKTLIGPGGKFYFVPSLHPFSTNTSDSHLRRYSTRHRCQGRRFYRPQRACTGHPVPQARIRWQHHQDRGPNRGCREDRRAHPRLCLSAGERGHRGCRHPHREAPIPNREGRRGQACARVGTQGLP